MYVAQILKAKSEGIFSIAPEATVPQAAEVLANRRIGSIVVTNNLGALVGILSERDLARGIHGHGPELMQCTVADLMTREVITCRPESTVAEIVELMNKHAIRHLPVLEEGELVGVISMRDVVNNRLLELEAENETIRAHVMGA
ncbi:MAG: CBS domain-containing protein [Alphaproteobacteria bacterium]|jgi:CBS domain-containing protein|nr:hypothetical protein [Rhodospirillaceae bacterium]MDP6404259.1 CBS domain-containing protein [Alphaproteobacteria bacterium]MDP6623069.1 CBS domain-containing protein [Alphaproteobacteria bacterium]|tara:strand:+ start:2050 stop:2481 length:432 start_codon:yes stop_codon:yes gene_type:complete